MLPLSACRNLVSRTIADMSLTSCPGSPFLRLTSLTTHGSRLCAHGCQLPSTSTSSSSACTRILAVPAVTASSPWPPKAFSPGGHKRGLHKAAAAEALGPTDIETGAKSSADASARARPGDKYFAEDSRPVVLYDGMPSKGRHKAQSRPATLSSRMLSMVHGAARTCLPAHWDVSLFISSD